MADSRTDRTPTCPSCGNPGTFRLDLDVRPRVYGCDDCCSQFTHRQRAPDPHPVRAHRRCLIRRWDQLADDVWHLLHDLRQAPDGAFSEQEHRGAVWALDRMWDEFVNERPRLPASRYGKAQNRRLLRQRAAHLDALTAEYRAAAEALKGHDEVQSEATADGKEGEQHG